MHRKIAPSMCSTAPSESRYLRSIWILAFSAVIMAMAIYVPAAILEEQGTRRGIAILSSAVFAGAVAIFLGLWIIPTLFVELGIVVGQLPRMLLEAGATYERLRMSNEIAASILPMVDFNELLQAEENLGIRGQAIRDTLVSLLRQNVLQGPLLGSVGGFLGILTNLLIVVFIAIFFLIEPMSYVRASLFLVPRGYQERVLDIWDELHETLTTWIKVQVLAVSVTVILVWLILGVALGMPHALVVAVFAGFATFIPNIGAFLPLIPIVIFTAAERPMMMLWVVPAYLLIQLVESNVITPRFVKSQLEIPSGALLVFQLVATALFGALGLLLAVPMFAALITLVREIYSFDILGLRGQQIEVVSLGANGPMQLKQSVLPSPPQPTREATSDGAEPRPRATET